MERKDRTIENKHRITRTIKYSDISLSKC